MNSVVGEIPLARTHGYFEATRSDDAIWLIENHPNAYLLAAVIAHRARWNDAVFNPHGLRFGEAFLGDHDRYGRMSEGDYRGAKRILALSGYATFSSTNKGTIARLVDPRLFRINRAKSNGQRNGQRTFDATTNLELIPKKKNFDKAFSTKPKSLSNQQKELADRIEHQLGDEWTNDAGKWINRIKELTTKCERVIAELESAAREGRIIRSPAAFAEDTWKRFR